MNTGEAFRYLTGLTVAIKLILGTITSSSFSMLIALKAKCRAVVPLEQATANFALVN